MDSVPPHILHHGVPEPWMGCAYLRLLFLEVVFFMFEYFRGINHRRHGATPSRRKRHMR
jgi:hypothetical protein